jgi:nucleoside-diphosphate-sugar epimerase
MNSLIGLIEELVGQNARVEHYPANPADMSANWANIEKAKRLLNWTPQVSLAEGISNLIKWYNAERAWTSQVITE